MLDVDLVDPRTTAWVVETPAYRVHFCSPDSGRIDTFEIRQADDVRNVIKWVTEAIAAGDHEGWAAEITACVPINGDVVQRPGEVTVAVVEAQSDTQAP